MARESFEIRFDKHGHILVEDPELARRLVYLLLHDRKLTLRLRGPRPQPDRVLPNYVECLSPPDEPVPVGGSPVPRNRHCPLKMCECEFDLIDHAALASQWEALGEPPAGQPQGIDP